MTTYQERERQEQERMETFRAIAAFKIGCEEKHIANIVVNRQTKVETPVDGCMKYSTGNELLLTVTMNDFYHKTYVLLLQQDLMKTFSIYSTCDLVFETPKNTEIMQDYRPIGAKDPLPDYLLRDGIPGDGVSTARKDYPNAKVR